MPITSCGLPQSTAQRAPSGPATCLLLLPEEHSSCVLPSLKAPAATVECCGKLLVVRDSDGWSGWLLTACRTRPACSRASGCQWHRQPCTPGKRVQAPSSPMWVGQRLLARCLLRQPALLPRSRLALLTYADSTARLDCTKTKNVARATSTMNSACTQGAKDGSGWVGVPHQLAQAHSGAKLSA